MSKLGCVACSVTACTRYSIILFTNWFTTLPCCATPRIALASQPNKRWDAQTNMIWFCNGGGGSLGWKNKSMAFPVCLEPFKINRSDRTQKGVESVEGRNTARRAGGSWSQQEKDKTIFKASCVLLTGLQMRLHKTFLPNQPMLDKSETLHQRVLEWSFSHCWSVFKMLPTLKQKNRTKQNTRTHVCTSRWAPTSIHSTLILGFKSLSASFCHAFLSTSWVSVFGAIHWPYWLTISCRRYDCVRPRSSSSV